MNSPLLNTILAIATLAALTLGTATAAAQPADLKAAYQREFSVLQAEKDTLSRRRAAVKEASRRDIARAEGELRRLQQQIIALQEQSDLLDDELRQLAAQQPDDGDGALIDQLFVRAADGLQAIGHKLPATPDADDQPARLAHINTIFQHTPQAIAQGSLIRTTQGPFFLPDGTEVQGQRLHIGQIATYGVSPQGSGALAPAGQGRLKIWEAGGPLAADTAQTLLDGRRPQTMAIFLHESLEKAIEPPKEKTALGIVQAGGTIAWVIVGLGALAALLLMLRALLLGWAGLGAARTLSAVVGLLRRGERGQALVLAQKRSGPMARVLAAALRSMEADPEEQERIITEGLLREIPKLERFGSALTVFAAVAPLLGLLGTVTGMIATFDIITEYGTGDPKLLSSGISEALITTELGLIVAIPTLLVGSLLTARAESMIASLERGALEVLNTDESGNDDASSASPLPIKSPTHEPSLGGPLPAGAMAMTGGSGPQ